MYLNLKIGDKQEVLEMYALQGIIGYCFSIFAMLFASLIIDRVSPKITLPFSLIIRAANSYWIFSIKDPLQHKFQILMALSIFNTTCLLNVTVLNGYL
jgi:hypothetical protein